MMKRTKTINPQERGVRFTMPKHSPTFWEGVPLVELTETPSSSPAPESPEKQKGAEFER